MFLVFMGMVMLALSGSSLGTGTSKHHNRDEHDTLCGLLGAAVNKWQGPRNPATKKVLSQAIFGNQTGGNLEDLKKGLPSEYNTPGNRETWCGTCLHSGGSQYPGWSIPHDLICMCTVGSGGFPFTHKSNDGGKTLKLCGKKATEFGCEQHQNSGTGCHGNSNNYWWNNTSTNHEPNENGKVKEHLETTWKTVVKPCLEKRPDTQVLETLLQKLKFGHRQSPSWAWGHGSCNGVNGAVCVNYDHQCREGDSPQWWQEVYDALTPTEDTRAKGKSTRSPRKRTRRNTGGAPTADEPEDDSEEDEPEYTGSTSTNNRPLPLLSHQQSGDPLTHPLSRLLSSFCFI